MTAIVIIMVMIVPCPHVIAVGELILFGEVLVLIMILANVSISFL